MSIFDINYNNKAIELLPPDKRLPKLVGYVQALLSPVQWLRDKFLGNYRTGTNAPPFNFHNTQYGTPGYGVGALVMYKQVVYVSLVSGNHDVPPSSKWEVYLPSFLGVDERILFNGQKLVLEFALNQYFKTNWRQPGLLGYYYPGNTPGTPTTGDSNHLLHSDIFTLNNAYQIVGFCVTTKDYDPGGPSGIVTSSVIPKDVGYVTYNPWTNANYTAGQAVTYQGFVFICLVNTVHEEQPTDTNYWVKIQCIGYDTPFLFGDNFTVYFPVAVYAQTNDSDIRNFINKIIPAGISYQIATY